MVEPFKKDGVRDVNTRDYARKHGLTVRGLEKPLSRIGREINDYMVAREMSQQAFADKAGITRSTLYRLMHGQGKSVQRRTIESIKCILEGAPHEP